MLSAPGHWRLDVAIALLLVSGLLAGAGATAAGADAPAKATATAEEPVTAKTSVTPEATATAKPSASPNALADGAADTRATWIVAPPLSDEPPGTAPALSPARSLGYFRVDGWVHRGSAPERAAVTFRVPLASVPEAGHVGAVRLYRLEGKEWRPVPTRHVGGDWFRAGATGGSTFAVGFTEPKFAILDVTVTPKAVSRGESVSVHVTVDNDDAAGTTTFTLGTDATTRSETVGLGREATRQFTFQVRLREIGTVDIVVDRMTYATVKVTPRQYFRRESGTPSCSLSASSSASRSSRQSKKSSRDSG